MNITDLKVFLKFLSRHKVYTFVTVAGFAVSLMFVIILGVFVKNELSVDQFHENKDRIYLLSTEGGPYYGNPVADYVKDIMPEIEAYTRLINTNTDVAFANETIQSKILLADEDFFNIFTFPLLEGDPGQVLKDRSAAVISQSYANRFFNGTDAIGKTLSFDTKEYVISGIMEDFPGNTHLMPPDIIVNYENLTLVWGAPKIMTDLANFSFSIYFLASHGSDVHAKEEMLLEEFKKDFWPFYNGFFKEVRFIPLTEVYFSGLDMNLNVKMGSRTTGNIYLAIAILILIVALLNYINMTVAQSGFRGKETAIRKLTGANRGQLVAKYLTESLLITGFAFVIGILLAFLFRGFFEGLLGKPLALASEFTLENISLALLVVLLLSFAAGFAPAMIVTRFKAVDVVKGALAHKVKTTYSKVLIVFQFTVCIVLLISTFGIIKQARYLVNADTGFNRENIFIVEHNVGKSEKADVIRSALTAVPGVEKVAFATGTPVQSYGIGNESYDYNGVPLGFTKLRSGLEFLDIFGLEYEKTVNEPVAGTLILNRMAYNALNPPSETQRVMVEDEEFVISGIFDDFHINSFHRPSGLIMFEVQTEVKRTRQVVVKLSGEDVMGASQNIRAYFERYLDGKSFNSYFVDDRILEWYEGERRLARVLGSFAVLALVIMLMGVFAMSVYMTRQKEKEIGVRKVNGATVSQIIIMMNRQMVLLMGISMMIGFPVAYYAVSRWLNDFPYKMELSVWLFALPAVMILILALVSVSWQTWRAAKANPVETLKGE